MQIFYIILKIVICIKQVENARRSNLEEDAYLGTHQLITKYKYEAETHYVQTEDNYILRLHRIAKPNGKPFFLMHGLLDTSATFIITGPQHGLGYYLSDLGYDVWMGNARGNRYSRNHTTLNPNRNAKFWNFSFHEIGIYDLPAMIDYVLNFTKFDKLFYVGHSQGTTSYFVMASKRPEYNNKILLMQALSPVVKLDHWKTSFKFFLVNLFKSKFPKNIHEFILPNRNIMIPFCKIFTNFCMDLLHLIMGPSEVQFNMKMLPILLGHLKSTCSTRQVHHYVQIYESKRFCEFDFGKKKNMKIYGKSKPPDYNISEITSPIFLYYSLNDFLSSSKDVEQLIGLLPNVQGKYLVEIKKWNHIDFVWSNDARKMIYKRIGDEANKFISN